MKPSSLNVLQVIPSVAVVQGGPSQAIRSIERALTARGVTVETVTTDDDGPGKRNGRLLRQPLEENGVVRRYFAKRLEFYKVSPGLARWLLGNVARYDLVHIHALFSFSSVVAAWAARRAGVPYVLRPLGVLTRYGVERRRPWLKQWSIRFIEGPLLRDAAAVHFTSEAEREEATALGIPMRGVVIPLAVAAAAAGNVDGFLARVDVARTACRLVYLSRLDPKKNVEGLLKALAILRAEAYPIVLLVGGSGDPAYVASLRELARAEGVAERVVWFGHVSGQDKADLLAAGDIFVLPSYSENFGIAAAEALAASLPCVVGKGVALSTEIEASGAGVATSPEPQAIAGALRRLVSDEALRHEMSLKAGALARSSFSPDALGNRLVSLYERIKTGNVLPISL